MPQPATYLPLWSRSASWFHTCPLPPAPLPPCSLPPTPAPYSLPPTPLFPAPYPLPPTPCPLPPALHLPPTPHLPPVPCPPVSLAPAPLPPAYLGLHFHITRTKGSLGEQTLVMLNFSPEHETMEVQLT